MSTVPGTRADEAGAIQQAVRLLLDRGADIEVRDTTWDATPLGWAIVGSGERPKTNPDPDWIATAQTLIEAGASTVGVTLAPDDPSRPAHRSPNSCAAMASAASSRSKELINHVRGLHPQAAVARSAALD